MGDTASAHLRIFSEGNSADAAKIEGEREREALDRRESIEQSYKLIALRSDCSFLCINPCCSRSLASPLARSLFPRHCCLSESSCPHSPFFLSPSIPWKVVQYQIRSNGLIWGIIWANFFQTILFHGEINYTESWLMVPHLCRPKVEPIGRLNH